MADHSRSVRTIHLMPTLNEMPCQLPFSIETRSGAWQLAPNSFADRIDERARA